MAGQELDSQPAPETERSGDLLSARVRSLQLPQTQTKKSGSATRMLGLFVLVGLAAVGGWFAAMEWGRPPTALPPSPTGGAVAQAATVETPAQSSSSGNEIALESKGYIIPAHQILVSPKVTGMVVQLDVEEGLRVTAGDVLAVIEKTEFQADYDAKQAALESARHRLLELERGNRLEEIQQAQAELAQAQAEMIEIERRYKRNQKLKTTNAVTEQEMEQSESEYRSTLQRIARLKFALKLLSDGPRVERIDAARADVKQAAADLTKAEWRLGNCTILAPISGTILKKNAEEGNIVNPSAFNGSFSLCEMADLSDLEVDLAIQERDISRVFAGQSCKVRADAFPDRSYDGVVSRLMPIADRAKGAVPVRVKIAVPPEEEGIYLKPEMSAVVTFYRQDAPTLPESGSADVE